MTSKYLRSREAEARRICSIAALVDLLLLIGIAMLVAGCSLGEEVKDPAEVASAVGVRIPASATGVRAHAEGFQDWRYLLEFEVPVAAYEEFAKAHGLELHDREGERPYHDDHWWTLNNREPLSWASRQSEAPNRHWSVIAFPTESDRCLVRLQVHDF